jgi:predicted NACHT family NTPase
VKAIAMTADGHTLASGSYDGVIKIWDLKTGSVKMSTQHLGPITAMAFSPDGQILASGFKKGDIKTWQWDIGKQLHSFAAHTNTIWAIAFSPNGKIIASGGKDGKIRLWQIEKGQLISTLEGHNQAILSVAFSPDGKTIASSGYDRKINLWEVKTEELLETFTAHSKAIWSLEFNPNGQTLVSGSADGSIKLWSLSSLNSKKLQSATLPSVVKKEVDIAVISEITDTDRLEELNQKLYDQIDQSWQQTPTWYEDLVFQMRVNVEGVIVNLEPVNQSARDYVQQTPLLKLLNSSDGEIASHKKSSALFRIVMTPRGALEVSPWSGWENYSSFY